ncbi:hypothetical protein Ddc_05800 [Ditylenchus destructor]|nr:hypothetical protein Ddc_05800 [Ditylenchus destructor]
MSKKSKDNAENAELVKIDVGLEARQLFRVMRTVYFQSETLRPAISFLRGPLDNAYKENVRLMTDDETKFFGSGQSHSFEWWKQFCRILSDNGYFVRQNLYNKEANRSHANSKEQNRRRITLSQKGYKWYESNSNELPLDVPKRFREELKSSRKTASTLTPIIDTHNAASTSSLNCLSNTIQLSKPISITTKRIEGAAPKKDHIPPKITSPKKASSSTLKNGVSTAGTSNGNSGHNISSMSTSVPKKVSVPLVDPRLRPTAGSDVVLGAQKVSSMTNNGSVSSSGTSKRRDDDPSRKVNHMPVVTSSKSASTSSSKDADSIAAARNGLKSALDALSTSTSVTNSTPDSARRTTYSKNSAADINPVAKIAPPARTITPITAQGFSNANSNRPKIVHDVRTALACLPNDAPNSKKPHMNGAKQPATVTTKPTLPVTSSEVSTSAITTINFTKRQNSASSAERSTSICEDVSITREITSNSMKRLNPAKRRDYVPYSSNIFLSALSRSTSDTNLDGCISLVGEDYCASMIKSLKPLGNPDIYLYHAFFNLSFVAIGQRLVILIKDVATMLSACARIGFPLHLTVLGIKRDMINNVKSYIENVGGGILSLNTLQKCLEKVSVSESQLQVIVAILEYEYGLLQDDPNGAVLENGSFTTKDNGIEKIQSSERAKRPLSSNENPYIDPKRICVAQGGHADIRLTC